jgi:hypothetical protein
MLLSRLIFNLEHHVSTHYFSDDHLLQLQALLAQTRFFMVKRQEQEYAHWSALTVSTALSCYGSLIDTSRIEVMLLCVTSYLVVWSINPLLRLHAVTVDAVDNNSRRIASVYNNAVKQNSFRHLCLVLKGYNQSLRIEAACFSSLGAACCAAVSAIIPLVICKAMPNEYPRLSLLCGGVSGMWTGNISQAAGALWYKKLSEWCYDG